MQARSAPDLRDGLLKAEVLETVEEGNRLIRFEYEGIFEEVLDKLGEMPLPPYITHKLKDKNRYQTVYAKYEGSAAAPTAGLHFTQELLQQIADKGIKIAYVTLHVGLGTFRPVKEENVLEHHMHSEYYQVTEEAANTINETKKNGGRVICVGTTSCRTVESAADEQGMVQPGCDNTEIFIYPGYRFKVLDALITNFHLPESTNAIPYFQIRFQVRNHQCIQIQTFIQYILGIFHQMAEQEERSFIGKVSADIFTGRVIPAAVQQLEHPPISSLQPIGRLERRKLAKSTKYSSF